MNELLPVGSVLRARAGYDEDDAWSLVIVKGAHTLNGVREAIIAPAMTFASPMSAAVDGAGGLLSMYELLSVSEVEELGIKPTQPVPTTERG